jgi:hypothetical protein
MNNRKIISFSISMLVLVLLSRCDSPDSANLLEVTPSDGWIQRGGTAIYTYNTKEIVGTSVVDNQNSFLCTVKEYGDFELELEVKVDTAMNSGIQIRSQSLPEYNEGRVHGYQIEIDPSDRAWSGGIYDEGRRGWLVDLSENEPGRKSFKNGLFNKYRIVAKGDSIKTWVNGVQTAVLEDGMTSRGFIAFQVHGTKKKRPMQVVWKNIRIKELK